MTYRGFRIGIRPTSDRYGERHIEVKIDGHFHWAYPYMRSTVDQVRADALKSARAYVDDSLRIPDAYTWTRALTPRQIERRRGLPADDDRS